MKVAHTCTWGSIHIYIIYEEKSGDRDVLHRCKTLLRIIRDQDTLRPLIFRISR